MAAKIPQSAYIRAGGRAELAGIDAGLIRRGRALSRMERFEAYAISQQMPLDKETRAALDCARRIYASHARYLIRCGVIEPPSTDDIVVDNYDALQKMLRSADGQPYAKLPQVKAIKRRMSAVALEAL